MNPGAGLSPYTLFMISYWLKHVYGEFDTWLHLVSRYSGEHAKGKPVRGMFPGHFAERNCALLIFIVLKYALYNKL